MWDVNNLTPFATERGWVRDRNGAEVWVVAVKCTFDIAADGTTTVSAEQPPVLRVPEHNGDPGRSSVRFESDIVLTKKTTDIILVGHAYSPGGRPVTSLDVGFRVGTVQKVLRVFGDRMWNATGMTAPEPFLKMPLVYERAFGGVDRKSKQPERDWYWPNPVGTGFAVTRDNLSGVPLPNIEYPDRLITSWSDRPTPAGFGAIAAHWQPRAALAGTYDDQWLANRQPLLPHDFDDRYFQYAPEDQQTPAFLRGDEPVVLRHLTPEGDLRFYLPKIFLGFETRFYDGTKQVHRERKLHAVILDPDRRQVSLLWHTALPCHFKVHKLNHTSVRLKVQLGETLTPAEAGELDLV